MIDFLFHGLGALIGDLEDEQVGELLDIVTIGGAAVAEQLAVAPELLNQLKAGLRPDNRFLSTIASSIHLLTDSD